MTVMKSITSDPLSVRPRLINRFMGSFVSRRF